MKARIPTEHEEQVSLFNAMEWYAKQNPALNMLFAIPNGGHRMKAAAGKMKAEGQKAGVPDIFLAYPVGRYHGLFLELKRKVGGRLEPEQKQWLKALQENGYAVAVARGAEEAESYIFRYIEGRPPF